MNAADFLLRAPIEQNKESYVHFVVSNAVPKALMLEEVEIALAKDTTLTEVQDCVTKNRWPKSSVLKP